MAGGLQDLATTGNALGVAIAGAAAGGGFALFNQIVSKGWDAFATRIGRSRQVRGLVVAAVSEVATNIDALLKLMEKLEFVAAQLQHSQGNDATQLKAQRYLQHHLRHICVRDAIWERVTICEAMGEHGTLALMLLPDRYHAARALFIETESLSEIGVALVPDTVNGLINDVRKELRASAHAAVLLVASFAGSKLASGAWVLLAHRLARLHRHEVSALTGIGESAGVRRLQRSVRRVTKLDPESAAVYHDAALLLGIADRS
jgi:hypothetical protein